MTIYISELLKKIAKAKSRKQKKTILEEYKDNNVLKFVLLPGNYTGEKYSYLEYLKEERCPSNFDGTYQRQLVKSLSIITYKLF